MTALRLAEAGRTSKQSPDSQPHDGMPARSALPPLDALRVFEAAARNLNFTKAAEELQVTQGAVSHRILALEEALGVPLFRRLPRRLELTSNGERLALGIRDGLDRIVAAIAGLEREAVAGPLTVGMPPSFATRWLMPRLARFTEGNPGIEVRIQADIPPADPRSGDVEVAVLFGNGDHPGLVATPLMSDCVFPVCSPRLLAQYGPVRTPEDLLRMPILIDTATEQDGSGADWKSWFAHVGMPHLRVHGGQRFSQTTLAAEAAVSGLGVALVRGSLVEADLKAGWLVRPLPQAAPTAFAYHVVHLPAALDSPRVARFRAWLSQEAKSQPL